MQSNAPRLLSSVVTLLIAGSVQAQTTGADIAASQEQLQQERDRLLRQQQEQTPDVRLPAPRKTDASAPFPVEESPCFPITRINLTGEATERFEFILSSVTGKDGALGRCLGTEGINTVIARLQNSLILHGYTTTQVRAAPQDLKTGELVLTILPGHVRHIRFAADADPRGTAWNALPINEGEIFNLRDIEQGLENFKRVPTAEADIRIAPSETAGQPGDSDLIIHYRQNFPFRLNISLDDGGSKATGKYQAGGTLSYDNWWTLNDLFYANWNRSLGQYGNQGVHSYTVHYSIPAGYWTLGGTLSGSRYHQQVAGANPENAVIYSGQSENAELKLSRLIYRDAVRKTTLSIKGLLRSSRNFIDDTEVGPQRRQSSAVEAAINHREFIGNATVDASLAYRRTFDKQGKEPEFMVDLPQLATRYGLFLADANINAPFQLSDQRLRYNGTVRAQWNRGALPSQDQFAIGSRYTVRGFDGELILQAERGWVMRNELALALGQSNQELYAAIDAGQVSGPSAQYLIGERLAGAAIGLRGALWKSGYEVFIATPIRKPEGFRTAAVTGGFSINLSF
ncbi:ShlB/FhaC/HecB family hemolysin secretion/activation protein [Herbaspirillum rhizosphaerae]|uniref:ShlB/FhaC/HecB family hemolysin secretion/activation protein n=1 Tax=Herbaspirillum rhizosphaerae TaxID=346179 RepID=UPI0009FA05BB|nr:ShlB/FhaC/HecB family hemolysin secretion/activation protein [Herbaspirillum rhizosphaerae]